MDNISSDLDSLVETDDCPTSVHVSRSIPKPQLLSKVSVATGDEIEGHLNELLSAEIELSKEKEPQEQKNYIPDTEDVTQRLSDIFLYDRAREQNTVELGDYPSGNVEQYDIDESINACIDADGDTPLHLAIICLYTIEQISYIINTILNRFPNHDVLNHQNFQYRQSPLHLAVITKRADTVRFLLGLGAQTTLQDNQLRTPAHIACGNGDAKSLKELLETEHNGLTRSESLYDKKGQTCLHIAVLSGKIDLVQMLLDHGADINAPDRKSGRTALHFAVEAGDKNMITCLLKYGLRADVRTFAGESPSKLAYGRMATRADVVEHLRRYRILEVICGPSDDYDDCGDGDDNDNDNTENE